MAQTLNPHVSHDLSDGMFARHGKTAVVLIVGVVAVVTLYFGLLYLLSLT